MARLNRGAGGFVRASTLPVAPAWIIAAQAALANTPPTTPTITIPAAGASLAADNVHMETAAFADPDAGDTHACTDWEIWTLVGGSSTGALLERIWFFSCAGGFERRHAQLSDAPFTGSYAGRSALFNSTNYRLRVRFRDSSGQAATEWSAYAERNFATGSGTLPVLAATLDDVAPSPPMPAPSLVDASGTPVVLPAGATVRLEAPAPAPAGLLMLELRGQATGGNLVTNPGTIGSPQAIRARVTAGAAPWNQPEMTLLFIDRSGAPRRIDLPASSLAAGANRHYWVSIDGSTFASGASETTPTYATVARSSPTPWVVRRPGYVLENFTGGLAAPVAIVFPANPGAAPDAPLFYVAEAPGSIRLVRRNGAVSAYATGLVRADADATIPRGLTGLCIQPGTGHLFATVTDRAVAGVGPFAARIVRLTSADGGLTAATQSTLLELAENQPVRGATHLSFGPDGRLYVHTGDGGSTAAAQDTGSALGKVLRLNADGTAPGDNPLYNAADGITTADYVYAWGLRDPIGGAWRNSDGGHFILDRGPSVDRLAKLAPARNFLWDGTDASMSTLALWTWNPAALPMSLAIIQSGVFGGSGFPATLYGHAFFTESGRPWALGRQAQGKRLSESFIDAAGLSAGAPSVIAEYTGAGRASAGAIAAGPDGLYFSDLYADLDAPTAESPGARVLRLRYTGEAGFLAAPEATGAPPPLTVSFTDSSTVPGATSWLWSFGDGATSTQRHPTHTYTATGCFTVSLTVTGPRGSVTTHRPAAVRVSQPAPIGFIAGSTTLNAADALLVDHLRAMCYEVVIFDDAASQRPSAAQFAQDFGLVFISNTVDSSAVAGEFRTEGVPLIFCEQNMLSTSREALAAAGQQISNQTQIAITPTVHPVTRGLPAGALTVFNSGQTINAANGTVAAGTLSPNALVLATRNSTTSPSPVVLAAEAGAALLDGYTAPARRVFLPFSDNAFAAANTAALTLLGNSVCWAMRLEPTVVTPPAGVTRPLGSTATLSIVTAGHPARAHQWRKGGVPLADGGRISGATTARLMISNLQESDAGAYDVVVSTERCGSVTSPAAMLTIGQPCPADFNGSGTVTVQDIFDFLGAYFAGLPSADINGAGGLTVQDVFDFLVLYFAGCPG